MEQFQYRLGFIGTGNMAKALIRGILKAGLYEPDQIIVSDKDKGVADAASRQFGIITASSNRDVVKKAAVILLCVKPQDIKGLLMEIRDDLSLSHLVISIAAGISIRTISRIIRKKIPIIRVMPNTPALIQKGISAIAYGPGIRKEYMSIGLDIFSAVGETIVVEESMLDLVTAVSGSGPGYIFRIMECMVQAARDLGLDQESAKRLVVQTFVGASCLAKESEESLSMLRQMVTSPRGTTEAGLFEFEKAGGKDIIHNVIEAVYKRSIEIREEWENES